MGLIWLESYFLLHFNSGHKCNCWHKRVNHCDKPDNGVMQAGKEIKSGLKLVRIKTDVAMHTCKLFLRKEDEHINILLL